MDRAMTRRYASRQPKMVDPCAARFVLFHSHIPEWFRSYADAARYADEWGIPRTKICRTQPQR